MSDVAAMVETMPLERAAEAYARMMSAKPVSDVLTMCRPHRHQQHPRGYMSAPRSKAITEEFFAAYDGHDVDGMLALCADGAQGRYLPYARKATADPGGLEQICAAAGAVAHSSRVVEMIQAKQHPSYSVARRCHAGGFPACNERQVRPHRPRLHSSLQREGQIMRLIVIGQHRHQRH